MTESELRKKHAVRVAWSNTTGTLMQLLRGAFYNAPDYAVLCDFASVMGVPVMRAEWERLKIVRRNDPETTKITPYIEKYLARIEQELSHGRLEVAA